MSDEQRYLGRVVRAGRAVEDMTFAIRPDRLGRRRTFCDFRTTDGEPLVLEAGDSLTISEPLERAK